MNKQPGKLIFVPILLLVTTVLSAREVSEMWSRLYARAGSLEQKYAVMQNLIEQDDAGLAPTLQTALDELLRISENLKSPTERETWVQLCRIIVSGLGRMKAVEAAPLLYRCFETSTNPVLKAESLTAIGKVKGLDFTEQISLLLKDLNLNPDRDSQAAEIIAYGSINALEKLGGPLAYRQVFLASVGWYSKRVKDRAAQALPNIVEDPTEILGEIMKEAGPEVKLAALQAADESRGSDEKKILLAVGALGSGLYEQPKDLRQQARYGELRVLAISLLVKLRAKSEASLPLLKQVIERNYDVNEKLSAVTALGINGGDGATKILAEFLDKQNQRQASGLPDPDNRFTTALIRSLGITKNPLGRPALLAVEFSNYTPAMIRTSKEALQEIDQR